jgi:dihydroflavonol-4-reductase
MSTPATKPQPLVLVTGANGFLARRVVKRLQDAGVRVRGTLRDTSAQADGIEIVPASLNDPASLRRACEGVDVIVHVAAAMGGSGSALVHSNVVGTRNLCAAAKEAGVKRLVNISSLAVYDADFVARQRVIDEVAPLESQPGRRDPYCYSKVMQERVVLEAGRNGLEVVIVRPGVIYGYERMSLGTRLGLHYGSVLIRIGGRRKLPYTFVENCAEAIALVALSPGAQGAYNVVDDSVPTVRQLVSAYRKRSGKVHIIPIPRMLVGLLARGIEWYHQWSQGQLPAVITRMDVATLWQNRVYPNAKLKKDTGWQQRVSAAQALQTSQGA